MILRCLAAALVFLLACPALAASRLDRQLASEMERGLIDDRDAAVYRLVAVTRPDLLPLSLRGLALDDLAAVAEADRAGCATPRILDLLRRHDSLDGDQRALVAAALGWPLADPAFHPVGAGGDALPPPPEASESCNAAAPNEQESENFVVKWGPSYNGGGVDDVLTAMEEARRVFVEELGYQQPYGVGSGWKLPIFIGNSGGGMPTIGWSGGYTTLCTDHQGAYIVLSQDFQSWEFTADVGPHELFHAVQFGYGGAMMIEGYWWEATAVWSEDLAYPDLNGYVWFLSEYTSGPHQALNLENGIHEYGMFIFPMAIEEFVDEGADALRRVWEQPGSGQIPDALGAILEESHGTTFDDAFAVFTARASVMEDFEDGALFGIPSRIGSTSDYPASGEDEADYPPQTYGTNFIELKAPDVEPPNTKLRFEFDGAGESSWVLGALRHRVGEGTNKAVPGDVGGDGTATMEFIDFGTLYDGVVVGVSWTGGGSAPPYSWSADIVEQTEPQGDDDDGDDDDSADPYPSGCLSAPSPYHFSMDEAEAANACRLGGASRHAPVAGGAIPLALVAMLVFRRRGQASRSSSQRSS